MTLCRHVELAGAVSIVLSVAAVHAAAAKGELIERGVKHRPVSPE